MRFSYLFDPVENLDRDDHYFLDEPLVGSHLVTLPAVNALVEPLGSHLNKHLQLLVSFDPSQRLFKTIACVLIYPVLFSNGTFYIPFCSLCHHSVDLQTLFNLSSSFPYFHNVFNSACPHVLAALSHVFSALGIFATSFMAEEINSTLLSRPIIDNTPTGWFESSTFSSPSSSFSLHLYITPGVMPFMFRWNSQTWYCMLCRSNVVCTHLAEFDLPKLHKLKKKAADPAENDFDSKYVNSYKLYPGTSYLLSFYIILF
jgi:hypothetical protein